MWWNLTAMFVLSCILAFILVGFIAFLLRNVFATGIVKQLKLLLYIGLFWWITCQIMISLIYLQIAFT